MGRPPLGPAKKSRTIAIHVTEAEYQLIAKHGSPGPWCRQAVLATLTARAPTPRPKVKAEPKPEEPPPVVQAKQAAPLEVGHRHRRRRTGEKWVGGEDVGTWECATCGATLGILQ
jgi:hypothetical protein